MACITLEVFDAKTNTRLVATLENVTHEDSIMAIKKRLSQRKFYDRSYWLSLPVNRIALRLDAKGKNLKDDLIIRDLNLPSACVQLYIRDLGLQIGWKTVFIFEYLGPLLIYPIFYFRPFFIYENAGSRTPIPDAVSAALVCWTIHYIKRLIETQFVHRFSNATMPLQNIFKNCSYYWAFTAYVSYYINHPLYTPPAFGFSQILFGFIGFVLCEAGNLSVHLLLRNLRPPGTKIRKIPLPDANPLTFMFNFVSCPNYTYEFGSWLFFSCMCQSLPGKRGIYCYSLNYCKFVMSVQGLQAIVLCGGAGNRMTSLTNRIPKCMLPIAGVPMFWYPLNFLERNNIREVIMVVPEKLISEIKQLLSGSKLPSLRELQVEFVKLSSAAQNWGTADVLRFLRPRIKNDFVVVSGDFVSDMNFAPMLSLHIAENSCLTCLLCDRVITGPVVGPKIKHSKGRDFVVLSDDNRLLFIGSEEDYDETVPVNIDFFSTCESAYFTARYNDCHIYIMKKWTLDIIKKNRKFSSLKADFIPYILEKRNMKDIHEVIDHHITDPLDEKVQKFSFGSSTVNCLSPLLKCCAYLIPPENGFIVGHINNIEAYFEINKTIVRFLSPNFSEKFFVGQSIDNAGVVASGSESYISSSVRFYPQIEADTPSARSEKPIIKRSVVGDKCVIGPKCKITGSVLMNGCHIGARAQITNSIICMNVEIGENADIFSSIITSQQSVPADSNSFVYLTK
ncbi:unnamed protein product [Thelazia callipaeda]|uniref:Translation initiation factor eIF2B subunit gamma n=1 Tax=Thelazia callipaeda TaxID=103827 RepID=A0A0N5CPL4_THECL|nr:unnamed protein product [Thelazia callipaeda]